MKQVSKEFFKRDALVVAKELLGKVVSFNGTSGMIVETEGYKSDPASHGYKITPRSEIMLKSYGHVYVYLVYGMYYCINFTTNKGEVGAVLIRALEPLEGIDKMKKNRKTDNLHNLMSGPGKLCQAMGVSKKQNNSLVGKDVKVFHYKKFKDKEIVTSGRIGIKEEKVLDWRFYVKESGFVSKK